MCRIPPPLVLLFAGDRGLKALMWRNTVYFIGITSVCYNVLLLKGKDEWYGIVYLRQQDRIVLGHPTRDLSLSLPPTALVKSSGRHFQTLPSLILGIFQRPKRMLIEL